MTSRDPNHWLLRFSAREWIQAGLAELRRAAESFAQRNLRAGHAGALRAAGMALNGALVVQPNERWGRSYVDHVRALAQDESAPAEAREAARTLLDAPAPGGPVIQLRTPSTDSRFLEAARTLMAHAYALVLLHEPEPPEPEAREATGPAGEPSTPEETLEMKPSRDLTLALLLLVAACGPAAVAPSPPPPPVTPQATGPIFPEDPRSAPRASASAAASAPVASAAASGSAPVGKSPPPAGNGLARGNGAPGDDDLKEGDRAYEADEYPAAEKAFRAARKKAPRDPAPIVGLARVAIGKAGLSFDYNTAPKSRVVDGAIQLIRQALKLDETYAMAYVDLGRALLIQGKGQEALEALRKAAELAGGQGAEARSALGVALLATGSPDDAVKELARAVQLDPDSPSRHTNLGAVLMTRGKIEEAIKAFEMAVKLAPDDPRAVSDLGAAYLALGDLTKAMPRLEQALKLDPKRPGFHTNLAYAKMLKGDLDGAIASAREALKLDPKFASAHINLGIALSRKKDYPAARKAFEEALAIDPTDPRPRANLEELKQLEAGKTP